MENEKELGQQEKEETGRVKLIEQAAAKSDEYGSTMEALRQAGESLPVFSGTYDAQINDIFNQIVNRKGFTYDPEYDPRYLSYRQRYEREGRNAMRDTVAQASALTGGYASSYAQTVGQQQYGAYLEKLGNVMPELYSAAYERYKSEGDAMSDQLRTLGSLADREYGQYRDLLSDAKADEKQSNEVMQTNYKNLYELMLKTGYDPSAEEMERSGMNAAQVEAVRRAYYRSKGLPFPGDVRRAVGGGGESDYNYYINFDFSKLKSGSGMSAEDRKIAANTGGAYNPNKGIR